MSGSKVLAIQVNGLFYPCQHELVTLFLQKSLLLNSLIWVVQLFLPNLSHAFEEIVTFSALLEFEWYLGYQML